MFRPTTAAALSLRVAIMRTPHRPWLPRRLLHVCAVRQDYELHRRASSRVHTVAQMLRGRPRDLCWHQVSLGRGMASSTNPDSKEHDTTANELQVPELESFETPFDYFDMFVVATAWGGVRHVPGTHGIGCVAGLYRSTWILCNSASDITCYNRSSTRTSLRELAWWVGLQQSPTRSRADRCCAWLVQVTQGKASQFAAHVNEAYDIVRNPTRRAQYLVSMARMTSASRAVECCVVWSWLCCYQLRLIVSRALCLGFL